MVNWALGFLGLIAVVFFIYSGYLYVLDAGNGDNTDKAKKIMINTSIGILLIIASYSIVNTLLDAGNNDSSVVSEVGANTGQSFNASAVEVSSLARSTYEKFILFTESQEEIKNVFSDLEKTH